MNPKTILRWTAWAAAWVFAVGMLAMGVVTGGQALQESRNAVAALFNLALGVALFLALRAVAKVARPPR